MIYLYLDIYISGVVHFPGGPDPLRGERRRRQPGGPHTITITIAIAITITIAITIVIIFGIIIILQASWTSSTTRGCALPSA